MVPPAAATYRDDDAAYIRIQFDEWTPDPLPSTAWVGIVSENTPLIPNPEPTKLATAPTIYAAWRVEYNWINSGYEGRDVAPARGGVITFSGYTEPGARKGGLGLLWQAILSRLDAADPEGRLCFDIEDARPMPVGRDGKAGPWFVENLVVPFTGG